MSPLLAGLGLVTAVLSASCFRSPVEIPSPEIRANLVFFYYDDLAGAQRFYEEVLGLERVLDYGFASIHRVAPTSYLGLVDGERGMHDTEEPKTVTLSFITDEVEGWFAYLEEKGVRMHRPLRDATRHPTRGFVALDPEGYFLEFETFLDHPQNTEILARLEKVSPLFPEAAPTGEDAGRPSNLGVRGTVFWLYYKDLPEAERFYTEVIGQARLVDQGFAKVYSSSGAGFIGLVDEAQGLHRFSGEKAVNVVFMTPDVEAWFRRLESEDVAIRKPLDEVEEGLVRAFVALDPAGYFLEFHWFRRDPRNDTLLSLLSR